MRHLRRLGIAVGALAAMLAFMTGTALAGGWAEVSLTDSPEDPPIAGEERDVRFSLLQHGVTAVDFGEVQLTATHQDSGQIIAVPARNHGGGIWSAVVTFPAEGDWQIGIAHNGLETSPPTMLAVGQHDGLAWLPGAISVGAFLLAAAAVVGSMVLIARARPSAARVTTTAAPPG